MQLLYSKKRDVFKLSIVMFGSIALSALILEKLRHELIFFFAGVIGSVWLCWFVANFYLQRLDFYDEKVIRVYILSSSSVEINYEQIAFARIAHVYREGLQLFLYSKKKENGRHDKVQWDFDRKNDQRIVEILRERGIEVIFE